MAAEFLHQLPKEDSPTEDCPICLVAYGINEHAVRLPCHHIVGSDCIASWLTCESNPQTCPFCRSLLSEDPESLYYSGEGTIADRAIERIALREPDWTLENLRAWLRRRLEPNAPSTEAEVEEWWLNTRHLESADDLFAHRELLTDFYRIIMYQYFLSITIPGRVFPPLQPTTSRELTNPVAMGVEHGNAYFSVMADSGAYSHHFWVATAKGASPRQIHDLLRQELYMFALPREGFTAPRLGNWAGMLNDGINRLRGETGLLETGAAFLTTMNERLAQLE